MHPFYQTELKQIRQNLVLMGERAIEVVRFAVQSLVEGDVAMSDQVIKMDDRIDELELAIDSEAIRYISLRSPVASDLRLLTMAMKACHDLERVGDEATTIAKYARQIHDTNPPGNLRAIPLMAELVIEQLRNAMDSFISEDASIAYSVPKQDRQIDDLHRQNYRELTEGIRKAPELTEQSIELIFISKALERIGDPRYQRGGGCHLRAGGATTCATPRPSSALCSPVAEPSTRGAYAKIRARETCFRGLGWGSLER